MILEKIFKSLLSLISAIVHTLSYILLILLYVVYLVFQKLASKLTFLKPIVVGLENSMKLFDGKSQDNISRKSLIQLAIQNMTYKKARLYITVGGMTVGIASIVFLVSIGYGLQSLVVNRVARLEEMRQTDVSILPGSKLQLNDETIETFQEFGGVNSVQPQIGVVGKINYNNSLTEVVVYGVTKDYLIQSEIAPVLGTSYKNNELDILVDVEKEITYESAQNLNENKDEYLLDEWVDVEGESDDGPKLMITKVKFPDSIKDREAVVNRAFLSVVGITESEAIGKEFTTTLIATDKNILADQGRLESTAVEYKIVGVTPDDLTPLLYVPFVHLKALGLTSYSQLKVSVENESQLADARTKIEAQGYTTSSVADTVSQINSLFATTRLVLALIGTIALFVAALGMFNTLTVSLLEKTREIGLLRAMGMKSAEIKDLFLAESMIMGTLGGIFGILLGFAIGKLVEVLVSIYAISNGAGYVNIVDLPILFTLFVILLSFLVGVITGIYPATRATKISALNALRYE